MHYNLIKASNRPYLEEVSNIWHQMDTVSKSVNIIQQTAWQINKPVYEVMHNVFINNWGIGNIPVDFKTIEFPPKPHDIATNKESRKQYSIKARAIHQKKGKLKSKWIQTHRILEEATTLKNFTQFYYPQQLDFRSRVYPKPAMLSPIGADQSRALLKFAVGKPMGSDRGFENFAVGGVGLHGEFDKEKIEDRLKWVEEHTDLILECAAKPLEQTWWAKADKPYCFLAWCFEFSDFHKSDYSPDFVTTLPIQSDCSNSGLQHYSAMMRDEVGGRATNLIPLEKPADVYNEVANKLTEILKKKTDSTAKKWLDYGIDRKLCKKPVMCMPYSLTQYSAKDYLKDAVEKDLEEKGRQHPFADEAQLFEACNYLIKPLWEAIFQVVIGAREIMNFLKQVARLVANENLPVCWTTPLGFPVQMANYKTERKRVKTRMGDSMMKLSYQYDTDIIDSKKTASSVCPNFIHSLDASVLMLSVVKAYEKGVDNFSLIHDSFGCVAPDVDVFADAIRDAFCEVYEQDVLANWAREMLQMLSDKNKAKFPTIPERGNLDLSLIKQSDFFCI